MNDLRRAQEVRYEDFEIEVSECRCGYLEVRVLTSPYDRPRAPFVLPYSPEEFEALMLRREAREDRPEDPEPLSEEEAKAVGAKLFDALFPGTVAMTLRESNAVLAGAGQSGRSAGLRLRLAFHNVGDRPEIFSLPWEMLYDPQKRVFLARGASTLVVRYQDAPQPPLAPREGRTLRVLAVIPCPSDLEDFDAQKAKDLLDEAVEDEPFVQVRAVSTPTLEGLRKHLLQDPCDVLHVFGHGAFREDDARGYLLFENDDGTKVHVSGEQLADHLRGIPSLRLAVLVSCKGGRLPRRKGQDPFTGVATALVQAGLPAAVAMQHNISVVAGRAFTSGFYGALALGLPVDAAMNEARLAIGRSDGRLLEWATPVLTQRAKDGRILDLGSGDQRPPVRSGIVSFDDWDRDRLEKFETARLMLTRFFNGRKIKNPQIWVDEILPRLRNWLRKVALPGETNEINFAAHLTIALAAGRILEAKSRLDLAVLQNGTPWHPERGEKVEGMGWTKKLPLVDFPNDGNDFAVVVSLSRNAVSPVETYLASGKHQTARIGAWIDATPKGGPGQSAVKSGAHAAQLAQQLVDRIAEEVSVRPGATPHLFLCAPHGFAFLFGQLTKALPRLQMYEQNFGGEPSDYTPSVLFTGDGGF